MKILWICNIMLPAVAKKLGRKASNKEGWITGLADVILKRRQENEIQLAVAFPVEKELDGCRGEAVMQGNSLQYYGFYEDTVHPEVYEQGLEGRIAGIIGDFQPDVIHCFGTEFPHTLAASRVCPDRSRLLIGIQGLCSVYADAYMANLPRRVIRSVTFRDWLKKDTILRQQQKYVIRGEREIEAIRNAGNITGRTAWDAKHTHDWNPQATYFSMNETLRPVFYEGSWKQENCVPHRIFVSQGDYPIKGLHYLLLALPKILEKYPDVTVHVAGNSLVSYSTLKDKLKLSAYGKYLRSLMMQYGLEERVRFLGSLCAEQMKEQYLETGLFLCCSSMENSPNSLGEAMLLGVPCVTADVGGIPSLFRDQADGILYRGYRSNDRYYNNTCNKYEQEEKDLENIVNNLSEAVMRMWDEKTKCPEYCKNARDHAKSTHNREKNYEKMVEIYAAIAGRKG